MAVLPYESGAHQVRPCTRNNTSTIGIGAPSDQRKLTFGQRCRAITREVFHSLLVVAQRLFAGGYSCDQVAEVLMPA